MLLSNLVTESNIIGSELRGDVEVQRLCMDSRKVQLGDVFVVIPSSSGDFYRFVESALQKGAAGLIIPDMFGWRWEKRVPCLLVSDYENSLWRLCDTLYDHPTRLMKLVGITGTNGKTTTAWLVRDLLTALGVPTGYLGTLGFQIPGKSVELPNTTPFVIDLYNYLVEARDSGVRALAMEVSSHALAQKRAEGLEFDCAVFTNLTQDHLDFHGTMEDYSEAKWRLFSDFRTTNSKTMVGCFNEDDPVGKSWRERFEGDSIGYGLFSSDMKGTPSVVKVDQISMKVDFRGESQTMEVSLGGSYNVSNLLSAISAVRSLGWSLDDICKVIGQVTPVPGRFEAVPNSHGIGVIVDYAHTPDAIEKLLDAARPLTSGKIITVFGCGGDRDAAKRPLMAKSASERSNVVILTSDNPRTEDPETILDQVQLGVISSCPSVRIVGRPDAIRHAINIAQIGDTVVIAGKGHEDYQIIGKEKFHMDDREMAREALNAL